MTAKELLEGKRVYEDFTQWDLFQGKEVLVTGACGSLGTALYDTLKAHDVNVTGLDINEYQVSQKPEIILSDYLSYPVGGLDYIFHCAAYKHVRLSENLLNQMAFEKNNASSFVWLLKRIQKEGNAKVILASTDKVTGISYLGVTKKYAEEFTETYHQVAVRLVNLVRSSGSVVDLWDRAQMGEHKVCDSSVSRYWMQKEDAVTAMLHGAAQSEGVYVVNNPPLITMGELWEAWKNTHGDVGSDVVGHQWTAKEYPLTPSESLKEKLLLEEEKAVPINSVLQKVECLQ